MVQWTFSIVKHFMSILTMTNLLNINYNDFSKHLINTYGDR